MPYKFAGLTFRATKADAHRLFQKGQAVLARMEHNGIKIDTDYLRDIEKITEDTIAAKMRRLFRRYKPVVKVWKRRFGQSTNFDSPQQLGQVFFGDMKVPYPVKDKTKTGNWKTDEATLMKIDHPFVRDYFEIKKLKKALGTYIKGIAKEVTLDGFLHTVFNMHLVDTYRSSSSNPNLQNIPVRNKAIMQLIRRMFVSRWRKGRLGEIDFSILEVRVATCYHKDPTMIRYIKEDVNFHRQFAAELCMCSEDQVSKDTRYCNPGDAPIWMADGSFKNLEDIKCGDRVMGWTRENGGITTRGYKGNPGNRKRMVSSKVLEIHKRMAHVYKVRLSSGRTLRCTKDHLWINGKMQFRKKENYVKPKKGVYLSHIVERPKKLNRTAMQSAHWLGGIYDGEGSGTSICQSFSHNPDVCNRIEESFADIGIRYTMYREKKKDQDKTKIMRRYRISDGIQGEVNFLNYCSPIRKKGILKSIKKRSSFFKKDKVVSVIYDGMEEVYSMTTSTGNYVAWGYASKNCSKNMFVFPQFYGSYYVDCAINFWQAMEKMQLKIVKNGKETKKSVREWLRKKGIKTLGKCDPEHPPRPGTFEHHVQKVEKRMWEKYFPVYAAWKKKWYEAYLATGVIPFFTGFRVETYHKRTDVINYPVQGAAFHLLLWCLIEIAKELKKRKMKTLLIGQTHDSVLADIYPGEEQEFLDLCREVMEVRLLKAFDWIIVPMKTESELTPTGGSLAEKVVWEKTDGKWKPLVA